MHALALGLLLLLPGDEAALRGRAVYEENRCSLCHSVAGRGNPRGPHDGVGSRYTVDELRQWIRTPEAMAKKLKKTRTPAMPPFDVLPAADIDALVAYLQTLKDEPKP